MRTSVAKKLEHVLVSDKTNFETRNVTRFFRKEKSYHVKRVSTVRNIIISNAYAPNNRTANIWSGNRTERTNKNIHDNVWRFPHSSHLSPLKSDHDGTAGLALVSTPDRRGDRTHRHPVSAVKCSSTSLSPQTTPHRGSQGQVHFTLAVKGPPSHRSQHGWSPPRALTATAQSKQTGTRTNLTTKTLMENLV